MFVLPLSRSPSLARRDSRMSSLDGLALRLFDESFDRFAGGAQAGVAARTPAMDVAETDAAFTVTFDVPGATREQLKVAVEGRRVSLNHTAAPAEATGDEAQPKAAEDAKAVPTQADAATAERVLYRERPVARYARTVSLPAEVDQAASQAKFENGVLTLVLAKKLPAGATQLHIA